MDVAGRVTTLEELEGLYGKPRGASILKVTDKLIPSYKKWVERSPFCIISTVGSEGTDGSPRGDESAVATVVDEKTLMIPDWMGNNRIDTLRNIVRDGRISLMFMVPGANNVIRVNGTAQISADSSLIKKFDRKGKHPRSVIVITIAEVYSQCARALMRSRLWNSGDLSEGLPKPGQILSEISEGDFDGETYEEQWAERAKRTMW